MCHKTRADILTHGPHWSTQSLGPYLIRLTTLVNPSLGPYLIRLIVQSYTHRQIDVNCEVLSHTPAVRITAMSAVNRGFELGENRVSQILHYYLCHVFPKAKLALKTYHKQ